MTDHQHVSTAAPSSVGRAVNLVDELSEFGAARLDEMERGGWLLAQFGDLCCSAGAQPTAAFFLLWLDEVHELAASPAAVERARHALESRA